MIKMTDGRGNTIKVFIDPSMGNTYEMKMSGGSNQSIYNLSGLPKDQKMVDLINNLMASCRGEYKPGDPKEFLLHRMMLLAWHLEWLFGIVAGGEKNLVLMDKPDTFMKAFRGLCEEMSQLGLDGSLDAALKTSKEALETLERQSQQMPAPTLGAINGVGFGYSNYNFAGAPTSPNYVPITTVRKKD